MESEKSHISWVIFYFIKLSQIIIEVQNFFIYTAIETILFQKLGNTAQHRSAPSGHLVHLQLLMGHVTRPHRRTFTDSNPQVRHCTGHLRGARRDTHMDRIHLREPLLCLLSARTFTSLPALPQDAHLGADLSTHLTSRSGCKIRSCLIRPSLSPATETDSGMGIHWAPI